MSTLDLNQLSPEQRERIYTLSSPINLATKLSRGQYQPAKHLNLLSKYLVDAAMGREKRIVCEMPPRHGKSQLISRWFPVWLMEMFPHLNVGIITYGADLAQEHGSWVRDTIIENQDYLTVRIRKDKRRADMFQTTAGGTFRALGWGGAIIGKGFHCLPAGSMVTTEIGDLDIATLVQLKFPPRALSFNHELGRNEWREVVASRVSHTEELVRITTSAGLQLSSTGRHRYYDRQRGYREAALLRPGDGLVSLEIAPQQGLQGLRGGEGGARPDLPGVLRCTAQNDDQPPVLLVQSGVRATASSAREGVAHGVQGVVLLRSLLARSSRHQESQALPDVSEADTQEHDEILLRWVPQGRASKARVRMQHLWRYLQQGAHEAALLLPRLRRPSARPAHARQRQFALQNGNQLRQVVSRDATPHSGARPTALRDVSADRITRGASHESTCPPHQSSTVGQPGAESRHALQVMSSGPPQVEEDAVAVAERLRCERQPVYDIQVAGNSNFFANGILVHNCLIIDDPIKDEQEAYSENEREKKWDEWLNKIRSRIEPGGSCVVLHQRWHTEDLIGRLLKPENQTEKEWQWTRVSFPAVANHPEGTDELGRVFGEALWPERFSAEYIYSLRTGNEYGWQALYQQDPLIKDGGYFVPSWFGFRDQAPLGTKWIRFWDLAATAKTRKQVDPDYTVGLLIGKFEHDYFVKDVVRFRGNPDKVEQVVKDTASDDGTSVVQWFEEEPGSSGKFVIRNFARNVLPRHRVKGFKASGPKEAYADVAANRAENGRVHIIGNPESPPKWYRELMAELQGFPKWAHDDQVDGLSKGIAAHERKLGWGVVSDKERVA